MPSHVPTVNLRCSTVTMLPGLLSSVDETCRRIKDPLKFNGDDPASFLRRWRREIRGTLVFSHHFQTCIGLRSFSVLCLPLVIVHSLIFPLFLRDVVSRPSSGVPTLQ